MSDNSDNDSLYIPDIPKGGHLSLSQTAQYLGVTEETVSNQLLNGIAFYEGSDHVKRFCPISVQQCSERLMAHKRQLARSNEEERQRLRDGISKATRRK